MKVLVLSDSHSTLGFMQTCVEAVKPDVIIHLGDYVQDGDFLASEFPGIRLLRVAGNCDRYRVPPDFPEILVETLGGVRVFMTHGHLHGVKLYLDKLIADGIRCSANIVLYGHTHEPDCRQLESGMWIMNPGSCGNFGGFAGVIDIQSPDHYSCRLIRQCDLEGFL